ncbi:hypothetical protein BDK88_2381 [Natrinema hispanicum]|uniref:Major facilitator superfamily (MFS) profile domain-containing protein n=1 Tax=Natrinema hispanicum TaxID=392421 RepID=A0A482YBN9_9EURY|nr:hypothetical protein [Natrinema hispanicum]RZV11145.1 hypothetical protein BDK88_2381 [Natrinema hispanicum]
MERGVRRRLDALIALVSLLLGIVLTVIVFSDRIGGLVIVGSVFVGVFIGVLALWYAEG